jgi:hypothetical protein
MLPPSGVAQMWDGLDNGRDGAVPMPSAVLEIASERRIALLAFVSAGSSLEPDQGGSRIGRLGMRVDERPGSWRKTACLPQSPCRWYQTGGLKKAII